jgi:hypothetical protein
MINKIIISTLAAAQTLTLFPLLFFGIYELVNSGNIQHMDTARLIWTFLLAASYATTTLLGSYKAITHLSNPLKAYVFLSVPLFILVISALTN